MASSSISMIFGLSFVVLIMLGSAPQVLNFHQSFTPNRVPSCSRQSSQRFILPFPRRPGWALLSSACSSMGCDGSILLDDTSTFTGEKNAAPNRNSARGFDVIDNIKSAVEKVCPGVVSCADVVAVAARDSVAILGGPNWDLKLGRRDARTASQATANNSIPPPTSNLNNLVSFFSSVGLSTRDMVALSVIYNETNNLDASLSQIRKNNCPRPSGVGDNNLAPLDFQTPTTFDGNYFKNLAQKKGLLHSDQQLFSGGSTDSLVRTYSGNPTTFYKDFVSAMIKMGDIKPLTGSNGEIRKNCRRVNN